MTNSTGLRIDNDVELLDAMMADLAAYQGPLGPGPYWLKNQEYTVRWLRGQDLNAFRRYSSDGKGLSNFGGGSMWRAPSDVVDAMRSVSSGIAYRAAQKLGLSPVILHYARRLRALAMESNLAVNSAFWLGELCRARDTQRLLARLEVGIEGDPDDLIMIGGRRYTPMFLMKFLIHLDIAEMTGPLDIETYVEIGPGAGRLAEIVAKVKPSARLFLVDIPPQLYVTHQVLHAIFPGQVAPYRSFDPQRNGQANRIFVLAPWQLERLGLDGADLAVCEAAEEMPKAALQGYFGHLSRLGARRVFVRSALSKPGYDVATPDDLLSWLPGYTLARQATVNGPDTPRAVIGDENALAGNPAAHFLYVRGTA